MNINLDMLVEMVQKQMLLSEDNVQNIYKTLARLRLNKNISGDLTQVVNEIRGVLGVTTVGHLSDYFKKGTAFDLGTFEIKFELVGSDNNPVAYIKKTLIPGIRQISGVEVQQINDRPEKLS